MSKAMAAGLFGSLRAINGALESAVAQMRSTVSQWRGSREDEHVAVPRSDDADDTLNGSLDATLVMSTTRLSGARTAVRRSEPRRESPQHRFPNKAPGERSTAGRSRVRTSTATPKPVDVRQEVESQQLSQTILKWIEAYSAFGPRDLYLWKWCALGIDLTTLPCVDAGLREHLRDTKLLSIMVNVLLDDIADRREPGELLAVLMDLTRGVAVDLGRLSAEDRAYVEFTAKVWNEYWRRAREYPCFAAFERLLAYDLNQLFNSIQYSSLLNQQLGLLNVVEHDLYSPHNMMMMSFATLDLMASPQFQTTELGKLREAIWHAQWMGRIGNLLSTWQREVAVGDFTSGVFARAVALGELTIDQLQTADLAVIESSINYGEHREFYQRRWNYHRKCFQARAGEIRSLDMAGLVAGHDRFFRMHVGSRGLI
jgi:hypothetical protein